MRTRMNGVLLWVENLIWVLSVKEIESFSYSIHFSFISSRILICRLHLLVCLIFPKWAPIHTVQINYNSFVPPLRHHSNSFNPNHNFFAILNIHFHFYSIQLFLHSLILPYSYLSIVHYQPQPAVPNLHFQIIFLHHDSLSISCPFLLQQHLSTSSQCLLHHYIPPSKTLRHTHTSRSTQHSWMPPFSKGILWFIHTHTHSPSSISCDAHTDNQCNFHPSLSVSPKHPLLLSHYSLLGISLFSSLLSYSSLLFSILFFYRILHFLPSFISHIYIYIYLLVLKHIFLLHISIMH